MVINYELARQLISKHLRPLKENQTAWWAYLRSPEFRVGLQDSFFLIWSEEPSEQDNSWYAIGYRLGQEIQALEGIDCD
jgi:hypothetical protein